MPPIRGAGHIQGLGWARFLGWAALGFGVTSFALALITPLAGDFSRIVWIVLFASFAIWCGLMAEPRYRSARGKGSAVSKLGVGLGIATIAIAIYAFIAIVLASHGTRIPAPSHWLNASTVADVPTATNPTFIAETPPAPEVQSPANSERLSLVESVGTAVLVLEQTAASDGLWPASLAVTTDATTLITPDGITLTALPPGTQVIYSTSPDLHEYSLTLIGPLGSAATYESGATTITTSMP